MNGDNTNEVYQWLKNEKAGILGLTRIKVSCSAFDAITVTDARCDSGTLRNSLSIKKAMLCSDGLL